MDTFKNEAVYMYYSIDTNETSAMEGLILMILLVWERSEHSEENAVCTILLIYPDRLVLKYNAIYLA